MDKLASLRPFLEKARIQTTEDRAAGRVTFGGKLDFFRASTEKAYRVAAAVVIEHALAQGQPQDFVQPAIFLLRHAVELELKELIWSAWNTEEMRQSSDAGKEVRITRDEGSLQTHDLQRLLDFLVKALAPCGFTVPSSLTALVADLHAFDDGDVTRTRYSRGNKGLYKRASYPKKVAVELRSWLERLVAYHETDGNVREDCWEQDNPTFVEELYMLSESLSQHLDHSGIMTLQDVNLNEDD